MQAKTLTMNQTINESEHESVLPLSTVVEPSICKRGDADVAGAREGGFKTQVWPVADTCTGPTGAPVQ